MSSEDAAIRALCAVVAKQAVSSEVLFPPSLRYAPLFLCISFILIIILFCFAQRSLL